MVSSGVWRERETKSTCVEIVDFGSVGNLLPSVHRLFICQLSGWH